MPGSKVKVGNPHTRVPTTTQPSVRYPNLCQDRVFLVLAYAWLKVSGAIYMKQETTWALTDILWKQMLTRSFITNTPAAVL